jgi:hypothetical protein
MMSRRASFMIAVLGCTLAGCGQIYATRFICASSGGASCPEGQTCPTVALGAGGCEDLPALFGHAQIHLDAGRVVGCVAWLPYGNPYYGDAQQTCMCEERVVGTSTENAAWLCPV